MSWTSTLIAPNETMYIYIYIYTPNTVLPQPVFYVFNMCMLCIRYTMSIIVCQATYLHVRIGIVMLPWEALRSALPSNPPPPAFSFNPSLSTCKHNTLHILICRRKFRSQTSDNMDRWKSRGGKSQRGEAEKSREEKEWEARRCRCAKR